MMCLAGAATGGVSRLVSALAIHNEMRASHAEHLAALYAGFHYHWRGEEPPGEPPINDYRVPVFSTRDGVVSCCYLRHFITMAAARAGRAAGRARGRRARLFRRDRQPRGHGARP